MKAPIIDALAWRYATHSFDTTKQIPEDDLNEILEAGNLTATAYGLQPFQFVVVKDQAIRNALVAHSWGQEHVAKNSVLIVLAIRTDLDEAYVTEYIERVARIRSIPVAMLDGFKQMMLGDMGSRTQEERNEYAAKNAFIALGTMMAAASEKRIDNHALLGFDAQKYDEILGLADKHLHASVILALGYRRDDDPSKREKVRKELADMVVVI